MATTEPGTTTPASPSDVGRHLRAVRKAKGLSRAEVARSAGLTRRELAAYERGRAPVPDSDLWCLAGSCGVDVGELLPPTDRVRVGSDLGNLTVGESVARLRPVPGNDGVLREYLAMVYELRNLPPGAKPPMRDEDLATLAEALGGTPDAIEARLHELIGASREEAARLRSLILPPRPLAAPAPAAPPGPPPIDATAMPAPLVAVAAGVGAGVGAAAPTFVDAGPVPVAPPVAPPPAGAPLSQFPGNGSPFTAATPMVAAAATTAAPAPAAAPSELPPLTAGPTAGAMPPAAAPGAVAPPTAFPTPMAPAAFVAPPAAVTPVATPPVPPAAPMDAAAFAPPSPVAPAPPAPAAFAPPPAPVAEPGLPSYPPPAFDFAQPAPSIGDPDAADRFFSAPHAEDPFAPPPPLEALTPPYGGPTAAVGFGVADPFGAPSGPPIDPFAPPTGPPLDPAAASPVPVPSDPFAAPMASGGPVRPDGFVADLGTDLPDTTLSAYAAPGAPIDLAATPDVFAGADVGDDPFGGVEMVVLDVAPDGTVSDPFTPPATAPEPIDPPAAFDAPIDAPAETPADPAAGPANDADDDPFAILRIPIEDADPVAPVDADAAAPGWSTVLEHEADGVMASDPYVDVFADAYTAPGEVTDPATFAADAPFTETAFTGAASTDAPFTEAPFTETAPDAVAEVPGFDTPLAEIPALDVVEVVTEATSVDGDDEPGDDWFDRAAAAADALIAEQRHEGPPRLRDLPGELDDEATTAAADTGPADDGQADDGPAPITWSLHPPAVAATPPIAPVPVADATVTTDRFVAAGSEWEVGGIFPATAMADDGALALRRADVRWALADIVAEGDFTVRATVTFTSGAGFGILFRVSSDTAERITGYSFDIDPIYSGGGFLVRQWNDSRQHWKPLAHAPVADTARLYGAHVIEVALRGDTLTASIDGETVMHVAQLSRCSIDAGHEPCRGGRIGVQAWSTTEVTVDRLLVAHH